MRLLLLTYKPVGITLIYLILGLLWITTSDQIAYLWFGANTMELTSAQILKGVFFILITALILYFLTRRLYTRLDSFRKDLDSIFANPKLAYVKLSGKGKVEDVSDSIIKITGHESDELKNAHFFDLVPSKSRDIHKEILNLISAEEETLSIETQLKTKDDQWVWVDINASLAKNKTKHFLLSIHDISERKKAETQISRELREKNALINNTDALIYSVDRDLCIVSFNQPFAEAFKKATNRQVQKGDSALLEEYPEEEQDLWKSFYRRALSGEGFKTVEKIEIGSTTLMFEVSFHPIKDNDEIVGVSVFSKDITKEVETLQRLQEKEEYLKVITDHANEAVFSCDGEGNLEFANKTLRNWLGDQDPEKQLSKWPKKYGLFHKYNQKMLATEEMAISRALMEGNIKDLEFILGHNPKGQLILRASGSALFDSDGNKIGAMVIWSDISAQVNKETEIANATLQALEKEREEIASELHDSITQLLGVVNMNLKNLALELTQVKKNPRYLTAQNELEHAIEETRNAAYRIMPKSIKDFGLVPAIEEMIEDITYNSDLSVNFQYNSEERFGNELELNLFRIVQEALNNIVAHSNASLVEIELQITDKNINLMILDSGSGFDPENFTDGIGIRSMQNRANKLEGIFKINKRKDQKGMEISVQIPLKLIDEQDQNSYSR